MKVTDSKVYRVVSAETIDLISVGTTIPIPSERNSFKGTNRKIETEDYFELIRRMDFPNMPSRKASLFVLPYDESIVKDWVKLHHPHDDYEYALLTLNITGDIIWCDEDLFTNAGAIPLLKDCYTKRYWKEAGDDYQKKETPEGLFQGTAIVDEIRIMNHNAPIPFLMRIKNE